MAKRRNRFHRIRSSWWRAKRSAKSMTRAIQYCSGMRARALTNASSLTLVGSAQWGSCLDRLGTAGCRGDRLAPLGLPLRLRLAPRFGLGAGSACGSKSASIRSLKVTVNTLAKDWVWSIARDSPSQTRWARFRGQDESLRPQERAAPARVSGVKNLAKARTG